ncbi:MAG: YdcF family protein [Dokdonella sp.]
MDLINALLSPLGFGVPLALLLWWARARLPRWLWRIGIAVELVCIALSTPLGANTLVRWQESRVLTTPACAAPQPGTVVLLTAGARRVPRQPGDVDALNASSLRRTLLAARLTRDLPDAQLVVSGTSDTETVAVSVVMAQLAADLGVPATSIRSEVAARTTWDNARNVRALEPPLPQRIWLVTSALHLPRALIAFRAAGFEPCAYPSDWLSAPFDGVSDLLPSGGAVAETEAVVHEWIGELVYRLRAWKA